ncbi:MAG TPA: HEAT repeat domain-containing protein, partial [Gemmataceae bacterium]|nr:HEAT repeat domain-containing protein [Gemmataceae bacterium]
HKWTSPHLMPVMTHMGPAAPCGLHCYESDAFGKEYTSNLFACQFNLRKVSRHVLKPSGSTYTTEDFDFVVSDNQDFHPTDVIEDADGSLLIVDTGGWYKLCCPSSQLVKADVLGAIYRVRRIQTKYDRKWLPNAAELELRLRKAGLAGDFTTSSHPAIWDRIFELISVDAEGPKNPVYLYLGSTLQQSAKGGFPKARAEQLTNTARRAVWALCRLDSPNSRALIRAALGHPDEGVSLAAIHSVSVWRDREAVPELITRLRVGSPAVRRAAAEALGRIGDDRATEHQLKALADEKNDRAMDHTLTYALIEMDNREYIKNCLVHDSLRIRRACLTALDQLGEKLDPKVVFDAMKSNDPDLKETAQWIVGRHPEWADQAADHFREQFATTRPADRDTLVAQLARLAKTSGIQKLLAAIASDPKASADARITSLRAMSRAGLRDVPASWHAAISDILAAHPDNGVLTEAVSTLRSFPIGKGKAPDHAGDLRLVIESDAPFDIRLGAMAALPSGLQSAPKDQPFRDLLAALDPDQPAGRRALAADVVGRARLTEAQISALVEYLPKASPLDLDRVLAAFAQTKDEAIGLKLVAALNDPKVRPSLRADGVKERIKHFPPAVQKDAEKLYALLNTDYEQQKAQLDEIAKTLKPGDVRRGQAVFNSTKTSCIACHTIGYVGGKIGPDLTRIGGIRNERDLLESILFPSASFVRSYEPIIVRTKDGQSFSGVPKKEAPDEIVLILAADKEVRILRDDIEDVQPGKVSIMPAGLDKQLTRQELEDLIAFLKACK